MTKERDDVQELKRRLSLLDKLDGGAIVCADGVFLVRAGRVRDPRPIVKACEVGRPMSAALRAAMDVGTQPVPIGRSVLAAAHRDLRVIEVAPELRAMAREAPRIFARYGALDDAWVAQKRARLGLLGDLLRANELSSNDATPSCEAVPPWFARVLDVVRLVHGDGAVIAVEGAMARLSDGARSRRAEARRVIAEVIAAIEGAREPTSRAGIDAFHAMKEASKLSGRSRARRVATVVRALLGAARSAEDHGAGDAAMPLSAQIRAAADRVVATFDHPSSPAYRDRAYRFFAHYALAFDPAPRDGSALAVRPEHVDLGLDKLREAIEILGGKRITLTEAIAILALDLKPYRVSAVVDLVEGGFPIAKIEGLKALSLLDDLIELREDPKAAEAYADWALTLAPHYASLGLDVPITPAMFATFRGTRREDLALLAVCLMKHHGRAAPGGADQAIARLDATLGLFRRRPAEAAAVLAELSATSPGAGRAAFPEFAAWLGEDALLDRAVHLMRLAELPTAISNTLRADFDRRAAQDRERAFLESIASPTPEQQARLARLDRGEVEIPSPVRTRRRLEERVQELHARAYEARVAAVFRGIAKEVWGISIEKLTPGWHDAIRFSFAVDDNRELLATVLRAAAEGLDLDRALPLNRAWISDVSGRFDVARWLAPRARQVVIGGETMSLAIERDPVEVLRMGLPFDTCLSMEGGCNAASTVVNAADANKRVIYLRDRQRNILARKLVAVSTRDEMVGYRLYVAAKEKLPAIESAFRGFCDEIAAEARLPLAATGEPKQIHPGFWYDDGTTPFAQAVTSAGVDAYCRVIGRRAPRVVPHDLEREAGAFDALERKDAAAIEAILAARRWCSEPERRAAAWLLAEKTVVEIVEIVRRLPSISSLAVELAADRGARFMLDLVGRLGMSDVALTAVRELQRFPRTAEIASAIVAAATAYKRASRRFDDHGFEHQTMYLLSAYAREMPIADALALCDRIEPIWAYVVQQSDDCRVCREGAEIHLIDAIEIGYALRRDPDAVMECLESSRSSTLARRAALRIAAVYSLAADGPLPRFPPPCLQRVRPSMAAMRALARLRKHAPELSGEPDLFAAILRQCAGKLPHGVALPVPREAPFEALGDLSMQLDLEGVLGPWLVAKGTPSAWEPTRWELYLHRRKRSARRAALIAEAEAAAPFASLASDRLAWLGEAAAIARIMDPKDPAKKGERGEPQPVLRRVSHALDVAENIALQIDAADALAPLSMPLVAIALPRSLTKNDAHAVDPGLLVAAFTAAARHLDGDSAADASPMNVPFNVLSMGQAPTYALRSLVDAIVARPSITDEECDFVNGFLRDRTTFGCPEVSMDRFVAIARHERLRPALFTALGKLDEERLDPALETTLGEVARNDEALERIVFEGWMDALLARAAHEAIAWIRDAALYRRAVKIALASGPLTPALGIYQHASSHERAAVFLSELAESRWWGTPVLHAAVGALREWGDDPDRTAMYEWLVTSLKR